MKTALVRLALTILWLARRAVLPIALAAPGALAAAATGAVTMRSYAGETISAAAVWHPDSGFFARFYARCDRRQGAEFDACFAAAMAAAGAPKAALDFTRRLDNEGYLQALAPTGGPVAVAHVSYPFRANENDAWLLVNGLPPLIDVDDPHYLSLDRLDALPAYAAIRAHYPNADFWPDDRSAGGLEISRDGREIIVGYLLRDLCHACAIVGRVRFGFDFAASGKFLGTRLVAVTPGGG